MKLTRPIVWTDSSRQNDHTPASEVVLPPLPAQLFKSPVFVEALNEQLLKEGLTLKGLLKTPQSKWNQTPTFQTLK